MKWYRRAVALAAACPSTACIFTACLLSCPAPVWSQSTPDGEQATAEQAYYVPSEADGAAVVPASAIVAARLSGGANCGTCQDCCNSCGGAGCGACSGACGGGCGGGCGLFGCGLCWPCGCKLADLGESCKLYKPCCEESQWSGAGWLAQGYVWNPYRPRDRFNGPMTWNDRANEYQMNELFYYFGRAAKTDECCIDWGGRIDAMYGTNYRWNTSAGFETHWGNGQFYGLAVPQLYGQLGYNNWDIKVGRWYSPVGYYVIGTANNFFPILPYTFQYGEPFTHTGIIATKKVNDKLALGGAVTHGWDNSDNTGNLHAGGLVTASYTIDEQRSLAYVGVIGNEPNLTHVNNYSYNNTGYTGRYLQTLVYTRKFSDDVMGVLQSDYGTQHDAIVAGQTAKWYGLNSYLYWNMTCRCQWGVNAEVFRDQGGSRVGQVLPSFGSPHARGLARGPGFDGTFSRFMFGPRYYFTPNIYGRTALTADWYSGKSAGGTRPFDDGTKDYQQAVVFDLIGTF
jgi:hypothetical protein